MLERILIALAGVFAVTRLKTELIPGLEFPIATVITTYPGAAPTFVDAADTGPAQVTRIDGYRAATVSGTITRDETGGAIADVQKIVDDYTEPAGVDVSMGGVSEDQGSVFASMGIALLTAVALALSGKSLGVPALIGLLMLIGIAVTNAIVLLEYALELRRHGLPLVEALVQGGKTRLRPILMTATATILALTPNEGAIIAADPAVVAPNSLGLSSRPRPQHGRS